MKRAAREGDLHKKKIVGCVFSFVRGRIHRIGCTEISTTGPYVGSLTSFYLLMAVLCCVVWCSIMIVDKWNPISLAVLLTSSIQVSRMGKSFYLSIAKILIN
jgi:hypothetical protein